jgi:adenine-specific DNA-methyltransferase
MMTMKAARQKASPDKNYRRTRRLSRTFHTPQKPLYQAVSAHLPLVGRASDDMYFCIKDGVFIDPPYNTGNDFVYADDFADPLSRYREVTQQTTKSNPETMGRFHTNWLNMMWPRLRLAANLLRDDGVIFISIDDHEVHNLRKLCDEIFGEENFVAELIWERAYAPKNDAKYISNSHDYVLMYAKSLENFQIGRLARTEEANARYTNPDNDPRGVWKPSDMSVKTYNAAFDYPITTPSGRVIEPPTGRCWRLSKNAFFERLADGRISFGADGNSVPCIAVTIDNKPII